MEKAIESKNNINREFYDKSYSSKNVIITYLHSLISYDQQSKSKRNIKQIKRILKQEKKEEINFLDYGFGHGSLLLKMPNWVSSYGCDISQEAVNNIIKLNKLLGKKFKPAVLEEFAENSNVNKFEIINCSHVLEHVEDDKVLLSQFRKFLRPNGKLVINLPINEVWEDPKHVRKYSENSAVQLLEEFNFKIETVEVTDRLTGFFLKRETLSSTNKLIKVLFRVLRLIFGVMPLQILLLADNLLGVRYNYQQLIIVATKNE